MTTTTPRISVDRLLPAAYQPADIPRSGIFVVLEGISESGKSTVAADLARQALQEHYDEIAAGDPTAYHLHTDGRTPAEPADQLTDLDHAMDQRQEALARA